MSYNFLVDSHCHLNFAELHENIEEVVDQAKKNRVLIMQNICTKIEDFNQILDISRKYREIFCSIGVHPLNVTENIINHSDIIDYCQIDKVIGIGETGLDFFKVQNSSMIKKQIASFQEHIIAAIKTDIPLIIHSRSAEQETIELLKSNSSARGVIHCFTGSYDFAQAAIAMDLYISASGIITFKNATSLQEVFKLIPLNKILVETDAPYLAPVPYRGKQNQPSYAYHTASFLAKIKNIDLEEVISVTTENFFTLFNKTKIPE